MRIYKVGAKGTEIKEIQSLLKKLGYNIEVVDGIYGEKTAEAVNKFQADNGIMPSGVIDKVTQDVISNYLMGFTTHVVQEGEYPYKIAQQYNTTVDKILRVNPFIDAEDLKVGQELRIPYNIDIVSTDIDYTYDVLERNIKALAIRYPFLEVGQIGKSELGRNLYSVTLGKGSKKVFYNGAHHSLEWITVVVLMKFIEDYAKAYESGEDFRGYDVKKVWDDITIVIVPMVNPDGIDLVLNGLKEDNPYYDDLIKWNNGSDDFSKIWNANARGVDLNHNYDASWEKSKADRPKYGVEGPGPTRYGGEAPESEKETKAVADFTRLNNFELVLAYHSQGEVIYWNYNDMATQKDEIIGLELEKASGYKLSETTGITSYAGYKDWFIKEYNKPGYTIEVGKGKNPLPISQFDKIYNENVPLLFTAADLDIIGRFRDEEYEDKVYIFY